MKYDQIPPKSLLLSFNLSKIIKQIWSKFTINYDQTPQKFIAIKFQVK